MIRFLECTPSFLDGSDSPRALLERCLDGIRAREAEIGAFVTLDIEGARAAADASTARYRTGRPLSPVDGCPVGVKDVIETAALPTQMNSPLFAGWRSGRDAACVRALRQGGAIVLGKTVTTEFAAGRSGPTVHPLDATRSPGGSSSGSAAAVAAGMLPVALGTQSGGSTIRPASYCGLVGFKPTIGTFSMAGIHPISPTVDHLGDPRVQPARSVERRAPDRQPRRNAGGPRAARLRPRAAPAAAPSRLIHLHTAGWTELDAETIAAFGALIERMRAAGIEVSSREDDQRIAELESTLDSGVDSRLDIMSWEMRWPFEEYVDHHGPELSDILHGYVRRARTLTPADYEAALRERRRVQEVVAGFAEVADGFVSLASSGPAPIGLGHTGSRTFLNYWSWLGNPSFSLPLMTVGGLPVGLQLIGFEGTDDRLAARARWFMEALA